MTPDQTPGHRAVVVIGAGFSGVAAAAALAVEGIEFLVLERASDVGGIHRDGTRPDPARVGAAVRRVVHERGLLDRFRFEQEVLEATWDAVQRHWTIRTTRLQVTANVLVDASGAGLAPRPADSLPCYVGPDELSRATLSPSSWACRRVMRGRLALAS
jgi:cation diffusion facilitator CzcD-associated flavoprotein CzcO